MIVGIPKEIIYNEYRVAVEPDGVRTLREHGHTIIIQESAGQVAGFSDQEYQEAGAQIRSSAEEIFRQADLIVKVKEPRPAEYELLREGQLLFTFLHLAADAELTRTLLKKKIIGIGYETVQLDNGSLPLLTPMSEIAGKLSIQVGAHYLQKENGGMGILLGGVPGVKPARVTVVGGGTVGTNAAKIALGMGAEVVILDINPARLNYLDDILDGRMVLLASKRDNIEKAVASADLVIGAALIPGAKAPKLITRAMVSEMKKGSVLVDVAIDQGGCSETSRPTTFANPVFSEEGVIHFCVVNLPGCVPKTATAALTNVTTTYILKLADLGYAEALHQDMALRKGLNVIGGKLTNRRVAEALNIEYTAYES
jgi:alanine dehydrogenase